MNHSALKLFTCFLVGFWISMAGALKRLHAEDWPQFRGPDRDAIWRNEGGTALSFPAEGDLPVRWRAKVGRGWASPVVADGRVFLADCELKAPEAWERLLCFEETTGKLLWKFSYPAPYPEWAFNPEHGGGPSASPLVHEGKVYQLGSNGEVHCLDAKSGASVWEKNLGEEWEVWAMGCRSSPLIEENLLILFVGAKPDASVIALNKDTGREVWRALDEKVLNSSPIVIEVGGIRQLIVWTQESVASLNPLNGMVIWRKPMATTNNDGTSTPVFLDEYLLIGGLMMKFRGDRSEPEIFWPEKYLPVARRLMTNTSTALVREGFGYSALLRGELSCFDLATGEEVWQTDTVTGLKSGASIHLTEVRDGSVLLFTDEGNLIQANLSPDGYREISRVHVIDPTSPFGGKKMVWPPPAFANGCGFFRNDAEVVCVELAGQR